jgi:phosphatidylglycerol:prolipoprotein diacylglycerol transferase
LGNIFSGSGLVWYGGAIGGAIGVLGWMRWRHTLELRMLDMCATALALGYAIGRIGCQVSGDGDYGIRSSLPWAMGYPHGTVPTPPGVRVQPTPIYETVTMCLLAYLLWQLRDRVRPGVVFALYLVGSGLERFLVEFIRRNSEVFAGLTAPQLESIGLFVIGLVWLAALVRRGGTAALRPMTA